MTTYTIYGVEADDGIYSFDSGDDYAAARAGTGDFFGLQSDGLFVDQNLLVAGQRNSPVVGCFEAFIGFDTSTVSGSIASAMLSLYAVDSNAPQAFTVEARLRDWGASVTTGDWVAGASLGAPTLVATFAADENTVQDIYLAFIDVALPANINQSGVTRLMLNSSRHRLGDAPGGSEYIGFAAADVAGTTQDPKLVITASSGLTITGGSGSYALTGTAANPKRGRKTVAAAGAYAMSGTAATPKLGRKTVAGAGSYSISGTAASLVYAPVSGYVITADAGTYSISGTAASPLLKRRATAAGGSYAITGSAANTLRGRKAVAGSGSYLVAGTSATPKRGYKATALSGAYVITGTQAAMKRSWLTLAADGAYALTGSSVTLTYRQILLETVSPGHERCMRCGFIKGRSKMRREWTGLLVCEDTCWEPQHPQMSLRGVPDDQKVPWVRPPPATVFLNPNDVVASDL